MQGQLPARHDSGKPAALPGRTPLVRKLLRRTASGLAACVLVLVMAEGGLRLAGSVYAGQYRRRVELAQAARPDALRILALGESTTAGMWCAPADSYPVQLQSLLRRDLGSDRIEVKLPFHLGQNSSQMVHRMPAYLSVYRPRLVTVMAGVNNVWSLSESNIRRFVSGGGWKARVALLRLDLDELQVFRVFRWLMLGVERVRRHMSGEPEFAAWPPEPSRLVLAATQPEAFHEL